MVETKTYDLTEYGTYKVKVIADGYEDSDFSNEIPFNLPELKSAYLSIEDGNLRISNIDLNAEFADICKNNKLYERLALKQQFGNFTTFKRLHDYSYYATYDELDYNFAFNKLNINSPSTAGACSAIRKGNLYGRNFDWTYDNNAEVVVKTKHTDEHLATLCTCLTNISENFILNENVTDDYKLIPFRAVDGINEYGVVMNVNVVPTDKGKNTLINPSGTVLLNATMLSRYILDRATSADNAINILNTLQIYFPKTLQDMDYESHYMIADENKTYLVEFENNSIILKNMTIGNSDNVSGKPYMTNFYLNDVNFNLDGTVNTPQNQSSGKPTVVNRITEHGSGLERYNLIVDFYDSIYTKNDMRKLLNTLTYTNTYKDSTSPYWYTEAVSNTSTFGNLTVDSTPNDYEGIVNYMKALFESRNRADSLTWQTVHSVIYDIENKSANITFQESGKEFTINLLD